MREREEKKGCEGERGNENYGREGGVHVKMEGKLEITQGVWSPGFEGDFRGGDRAV